MAKIFTGGALIPYGDSLPIAGTAADGSLFFRTNAGVNSGLYLFGFINDANSGALGPQVQQNWRQVSFDPSNFVLKTGDTMTGQLLGTSIRAAQGVPNAGNSSSNGFSFGTDGDTGLFSTGVGALGTDLRMYLNNTELLRLTAATITYQGSTVWHAANDGAASGLDADLLDGQQGTYYLNVGNMTAGILPIARGGTNNAAVPIAGSVIYGNGTQHAVSSVGTAPLGAGINQVWHVLASNGTSAPYWQQTTDFNVSYAATANFANSATTATSATTAATATNVAWTGITGQYQ